MFNRYIWCIEIAKIADCWEKISSLTDTYDVLKFQKALKVKNWNIGLTDTYDVLKCF